MFLGSCTCQTLRQLQSQADAGCCKMPSGELTPLLKSCWSALKVP